MHNETESVKDGAGVHTRRELLRNLIQTMWEFKCLRKTADEDSEFDHGRALEVTDWLDEVDEAAIWDLRDYVEGLK